MLQRSVTEECYRGVLQRSVTEECYRGVLQRSVTEECYRGVLQRSVTEECYRGVLQRSVTEECYRGVLQRSVTEECYRGVLQRSVTEILLATQLADIFLWTGQKLLSHQYKDCQLQTQDTLKSLTQLTLLQSGLLHHVSLHFTMHSRTQLYNRAIPCIRFTHSSESQWCCIAVTQ